MYSTFLPGPVNVKSTDDIEALGLEGILNVFSQNGMIWRSFAGRRSSGIDRRKGRFNSRSFFVRSRSRRFVICSSAWNVGLYKPGTCILKVDIPIQLHTHPHDLDAAAAADGDPGAELGPLTAPSLRGKSDAVDDGPVVVVDDEVHILPRCSGY